MFRINKMRADHVLDFAAEELKKYLWMMMPECGNIPISLNPEAEDGFRLGLLEDFGLPNEAENPKRDDVVHVDTDENGGILAGSNPRSVLFAVYRFLRLNGCRWLFAGIDGEYIPRKKITTQKYHKLADHFCRGHTTEGAPSIEQVLDYIDFHAKQEQNFYAPLQIHHYHAKYYNHDCNTMNREPEPVSPSQIEQWKSLCLAEIFKRGLYISDGDHGVMAAAIGIDYYDLEAYQKGEKVPTEEQISKMAMIDGKRGLYKNNIGFTNLCFSQPEVRKSIVKVLADNAQRRPYVSAMGVPFADGHHNHCECENCKDLRPSDFQVMICNELDEELTRRGIDTTFSISTYVDGMFAPIREKIKNPDRFRISFIPITRSYTSSITEDTVFPEPMPYVSKNVWETPKNIEDCAAHLMAWKKSFSGPCTTYEYHFWRQQYRDPGLVKISRRIYEDVLSLKYIGSRGILEDGSNKSFFPHGFHGHIYAETLVNRNLDYEAEYADYMEHMYGDNWKEVHEYFAGISEAFGDKYMAGEESIDTAKGPHYNPGRVPCLEQVKELAAAARALAKAHKQMPTRPQTVAYRLLNRHAEYCERLAEIFIYKCQGFGKLALEMMDKFTADFGKYDYELERYLDFSCAISAIRVVVDELPRIDF